MQTLDHKKAEITFRKLISEQHLGKKIHFPEEFTHTEMLAELKKRLESTRRDFTQLQNNNVDFTSYLEIGAEYGVRSALVESEFGGQGIALDIARTPLEKTRFFAKYFKLQKIPIAVCADAHSLPFPNNTFPFVFCYQTLHHFPNPFPIVSEIYRVLKPGGYFFFAEEPVRQNFNLRLFRRPTKVKGIGRLLKYLLILPFISQIGKTEVDFGIVEDTFSLLQWRKITSLFSIQSITISPFLFGSTTTITKDNPFKVKLATKIAIYCLGGGINGLLKKPGTTNSAQKKPLVFLCPTCKKKLLNKKTQHYICPHCLTKYQIINNVIQLLPAALQHALYR